MSKRLSADELLQEAFDVLHPYQGGSSGEADRKTALREKIARYLGEQGKPVMGGGAGAPMTFGAGCVSFLSGFPGGGESMDDMYRRRAKEYGVPVSSGSGGGNGTQSWAHWFFPDGSSETAPFGETPVWPKTAKPG